MRWADTPIHFIDFEGNAASGIIEFSDSADLPGAFYRVGKP
jgi:hypothetical protein